MTVPEILKTGLQRDSTSSSTSRGPTTPRDYCVQYRETDFNFASRLMEEEGIYYFFRHSDGSPHDGRRRHAAGPPRPALAEPRSTSRIPMSGDRQAEPDHVLGEDPGATLGQVHTLGPQLRAARTSTSKPQKLVADSVQVGRMSHKLKVGQSDKLEIYDYPGEYAQRFDGVDPGGGDRPADFQKIFEDNKRTVEIRMQEETASGALDPGIGPLPVPGHRLQVHPRPARQRQRRLRARQRPAHRAARRRLPFELGGDDETAYSNTFTCIPAALPFRPPRATPKPVVHGTQTAVVVGPAGEEIFTDKYGRVKVQFHWDRQGKNDANSSCWVRVGTCWAGKQWGAIHIPRIGQEVIVAFEEGDPDRPIIVGSVYNAEHDAALHPARQQDPERHQEPQHHSGDAADNFNELRFEDKKGSEEVYFHAEKDFDRVVENNDTLKVGFAKKDQGDQTIEIFNNQTLKVGTSQASEGSQTVTIYKDRTTAIETGNDSLDVKQGNRSVVIDMGNDSLTIKMGNQTTKLDLGSSTTEAMQSIELKVGQSSVKLDQMGVTIKGMMISIEGQVQTEVKGTDDAGQRRRDAEVPGWDHDDQLRPGRRGPARLDGGLTMDDGQIPGISGQTAAAAAPDAPLSDEARALLCGDPPPGRFLDELKAHGLFTDALRFLAHALPKREAVWWACLCARQTLGGSESETAAAALRAAERWAAQPDEANRRAADAAAQRAGVGTPAGCAAMAAFWNGGSLAPTGLPDVAPADHLTARGVAGSVLLATVVTQPDRAAEKARRFLALGLEIASGANRWSDPVAPAAPEPAAVRSPGPAGRPVPRTVTVRYPDRQE